MFIPDVFTYFIPYLPLYNILQDILVVTAEELDQGFVETITSNIGLLAGFITSVTIIGGIMVTIGVWLKKTVTKENATIRRDTLDEIERVKGETTGQIRENRTHIDTVKTVLEHKIDSATNVLANTLADQKDAMISIKTTMEKVDYKLERNVQNFLINKTRIDGHEGKIDKLEDRVFHPPLSNITPGDVNDIKKRKPPQPKSYYNQYDEVGSDESTDDESDNIAN